MAANGITVLKHNVPWGPFTRAQVDECLSRGDFTLKYLAHAPGLKEWLPLGEVLDYVTRRESAAMPVLPPIPESRELPPVPVATVEPPVVAPVEKIAEPAPVSPPVIAAPAPARPAPPSAKAPEPAPVKPTAPPVVNVPEPKPMPVRELDAAPFFLRAVAFFVDCGVIFLPVAAVFLLGIFLIHFPAFFRKESAQAIAEDTEHLWISIQRLAELLAIGGGWIYSAWYEASRGATIGKRWMGLQVVDEAGERISFLRASGRFLGKMISALPCFLGYVMAIFSSRGRALHDRLAGTRVVRS